VVLLLLDFGTGLPKYKEWNEIFLSYGLKYGIYDIHFMFNTFVVCVLVFSVALLIGIILTWRQKKGGHVIVIISQVLLAASPLLIMGVEYFNAEVLAYEWMSAGVLMLLFLTGYFLKLRKKA
jgi:ABC-type transport system involved in cytochrome c biogenesis permease component